jgi:hypothetical protein
LMMQKVALQPTRPSRAIDQARRGKVMRTWGFSAAGGLSPINWRNMQRLLASVKQFRTRPRNALFHIGVARTHLAWGLIKPFAQVKHHHFEQQEHRPFIKRPHRQG